MSVFLQTNLLSTSGAGVVMRAVVDDQPRSIADADRPTSVSAARPSLALAAALLGFFVITLDAVYRPLCLRALALVAQWQGNIDRRLPICRKPKA
jgi:hypothetical protein